MWGLTSKYHPIVFPHSKWELKLLDTKLPMFDKIDKNILTFFCLVILYFRSYYQINMQDDNIKKLLEKALSPIKDSLNKIESQLNDPETGLKRINEKLDANTDSVVTIEQVLKGYSDMYKVNNLNSKN